MKSKALAVVEPLQSLTFYSSARNALEKAASIDEVKSIRNKAEAMRSYAAHARDTQFQTWAAEIKLRAERRAGEMLAEMKVKGERSPGHRPRIESPVATQLSDLGVSRTQSSRWQKLASIPEKKFERAIATAADAGSYITRCIVLREAPTKRRIKNEEKKFDALAAESEREAFFFRAGQASELCFYKYGPIDKEIIDYARQVATKWSELADKLERGRKMTKHRPADESAISSYRQ